MSLISVSIGSFLESGNSGASLTVISLYKNQRSEYSITEYSLLAWCF